MTRIDFYIVKSTEPSQRSMVACRLAEKAYRQDLKTYIHVSSEHECRIMDNLLWTFRAGSFVPHDITPIVHDPSSPILIGHSDEPGSHTDVLINLAPEVPLFFGRFHRVAEIVDQQEEFLKPGRQRYRFYQERGYELHSHTLTP
jgi:DNA polymerase-3 subunit chi